MDSLAFAGSKITQQKTREELSESESDEEVNIDRKRTPKMRLGDGKKQNVLRMLRHNFQTLLSWSTVLPSSGVLSFKFQSTSYSSIFFRVSFRVFL